MDLQFKVYDFDAKSSQSDGSGFEGLVSAFYNVDSYGEIVDDGAFDSDLPEFMKTGFIGGLNHDWDDPIGTPQTGTAVVAGGLFLKANVIDTTHGLDVRKMLKAGVVKKLSIGYRVLGSETLETYDDVTAYWKSKGYKASAQDEARAARGNIELLTRLRLYEGSPVTVPANDAADITAVKMRAFKAMQDCIGGACDCQKKQEANPTEADDSTPRLQKIKTSEALSDSEDILREAGFTGSESKAFISSINRLKALPREVVSDDDGHKPDPPADSVTPEPETDDASATPAEAEAGKSADPADTVIPAPTSPLVSDNEPDDSELTPDEAEEKRLKAAVARKLEQRRLDMDALIATTIRRSAGA